MKRDAQLGLSTIETLTLLSLFASVLAVAIPTFAREIQQHKIAEASLLLRRIYQGAERYYTKTGGCLPETVLNAPGPPDAERRSVDFASPQTKGYATWKALGFQTEQGIRYSYSFITTHSGCNLPLLTQLTFRAEGDLDKDGELSIFERTARITQDGRFQVSPVLFVKNRTE